MRITPPNLPAGLLFRKRLLQQLQAWQTYNLIRVTAPAGFGKSTTVALWLREIEQLASPARPGIHWITFEAHDSSTSDIVFQIFAQLAANGSSAESHIAGQESPQAAARSICSTITELGHHVVLILDDFHLLQNRDAHTFFQALLHYCPPNLHLVILSRTPLPLEISHRMLANSTLSLSVRDLGFDSAEFLTFVQQSRLTNLSADQVAAIARFTEGWPALLILIDQALQRHEIKQDTSFLLHDSSDDLAAFLDEEVVADMSDDLRSLLLDTSFLPLLLVEISTITSPEIGSRSAAILKAGVAASSGLIAPYRNESIHRSNCYRLHPALRSLLLSQLVQARAHATLQQIRDHAASWLSAHGLVDATLSMASVSRSIDILHQISMHTEQDAEFAADLLLTLGREQIQKSSSATLLHWIDILPESVVLSRPRLVLLHAWSVEFFISPPSSVYIDRLSALLSSTEHEHDPQLAVIRSEISLIRALAAISKLHLSHARIHYESIDFDALPKNSIAEGYACIVHAFVGITEPANLEHRLFELNRAKEIFSRLQWTSGWMAAAYAESWMRRTCADISGALKNCEYSYLALENGGMARSTSYCLALIFHGDLLYHLDQITDARTILQRALQLASNEANLNSLAYHAEIRLQMCDLASGAAVDIEEKADDEKWRQCLHASVPFVSASTACLRVQRDVGIGRPDRILQTLASIDIIDSDQISDAPLGHQISVLLQKVFAAQDFNHVDKLLREIRQRCEQQGWRLFSLHAQALQLVHRLRLSADQWDLRMLDDLLTQIESTGLHRLVLNYPQLTPMLALSRHPIGQRLLQKIKASNAVNPFHLTNHEVRILRLLSADHSSDEIARQLNISVATVRTHVRHIYTKLDVHNRSDAIRTARAAGVLDAA